MLLRPDFDQNERQALPVSQRHEHDLIKFIGYGILLLSGAALFWIAATAAIATLKFMAGY